MLRHVFFDGNLLCCFVFFPVGPPSKSETTPIVGSAQNVRNRDNARKTHNGNSQ
jgi:hypothetical protein